MIDVVGCDGVNEFPPYGAMVPRDGEGLEMKIELGFVRRSL